MVVKQPGRSRSFRITPPQEVRDRIGLTEDDMWAWFYDPEARRFLIRRATEGLAGIPSHYNAAGVAGVNDNGRYLDLGVPHQASEWAAMEKGQEWTWYVNDSDTLRLVP